GSPLIRIVCVCRSPARGSGSKSSAPSTVASRWRCLSTNPIRSVKRFPRCGRQHMVDSNPKADVGVVAEQARNTVDAVYRSDSRHVLATLIRLLGDFDIAEEALHDAFNTALEQWPRDGVPANPRAWLVSTGRFKAIDSIRRRARFDALDDVGDAAEIAVDDTAAWADEE